MSERGWGEEVEKLGDREDYIFNCHLRYTLPGLVVLTATLEMQLVVCVWEGNIHNH